MSSLIQGDTPDRCFICQKYISGGHVHHCLHGSYRALADKYRLTVHLCYICHTKLHDKGIHDADLQEIAQEAFEAEYGHEEFMRVFQKDFTGGKT